MSLPQPVLSFLAASFATFATQPYDVLRTYRQLNLFKTDFPTIALLKHIYKIYGPLGFMRGFTLRLIKRSLFSVITWYTYEVSK
ncbi:hypothetical protein Ciccas_000936 [Cichlidogyrus casuarinus]|uniref:Uncharacterized protein n=1 Tax=Cichlidogyrus casuarinus TaxID=1844966 RepID=A0ABD2QPF6_9PLAT